MKKTFLVLPLAILLANCSSTRSTSSTTTTNGINASASTATSDMNAGVSTSGSVASSGTGTTGSGSMSASASGTSDMSSTGSMASSTNPGSSASTNWKNNSTASTTPGTVNWDVYDPNNYMQNPDKYLRPRDLGKAGGWTYNKDWRRNTNFTQEAVGQWQLVLTPEVAANWMPDTRRPETYASFWTPEAIMSRYQASMAAAAKIRDSIAAINATMATNNAALRKGGKRQTSMSASSEMSGATWSSGSGSTGAVGTGGMSATTDNMNANTDNTTGMMNNNVTIPFALTAVNGNNFMLPTLNLHIDNGSFTAYTGCNNAVGSIVVNGSSLRFEEASPATNVECIGGFDQSAFIDKLRRADSYDVMNNQFRLKQGDQVLMVFAKNAL